MAETSGKYNLRNPAVKRIMQEIKEMQADESAEFVAEALEENIFEWHFVIRGPPDTVYEGGLYHGRILLPAEYPFKPPSFVMLTRSGRFEVGKKICLSISERHPEHWQPSWSLRTALMALVAFLPTPGKGAVGSLDYPDDDKRDLAKRSRSFIPRFGNEDRQEVTDSMHKRALQREMELAMKKREGHSQSSNKSETIKSAQQEASSPIHRSTDNSELPGSKSQPSLPPPDLQMAEHNRMEVDTPPSQAASLQLPDQPMDDKDWLYSILMWAIGFLILALIAKKVLIKAGIDVWSVVE